jgi:predicted DNA-binding transcriptional regulator AlpA
MDEQHMTVEDLAHREQVAVSTVYQWNHHKTGPRYFKVGTHGVRYRLADVETWESQRYVA